MGGTDGSRAELLLLAVAKKFVGEKELSPAAVVVPPQG